jgi:type IV secretory pathway VirB4 component
MTVRPALRLRYHRSTTRHLASIDPFGYAVAGNGAGVPIGHDVLTGGAAFTWDPFAAYQQGHTTNPNTWILGEPGNGKSALVKTYLRRMADHYGLGPGRRWLAIVDPKGEYGHLADQLGHAAIRLAPGGAQRLNPLDDPAGASADGDALLRRAGLVTALAATITRRPLNAIEDAVLFDALRSLPPTANLTDLIAALGADPGLATRLRTDHATVATAAGEVRLALDKCLSRSLRGMFDGPSTVRLADHPHGVVLDLSAIPVDSEALPLVMVAAAGWLSSILATPGANRIQVLDEAWALLGNRHTAAYLQQCFKLGRSYGIANICIAHRVSDLSAQADDGTATAKIAAGLLADAATKVVLRQAADQLGATADALGLTEPERQLVGRLTRGRALWKLGAEAAVVQHVIAPAEGDLVDTDARMRTPVTAS